MSFLTIELVPASSWGQNLRSIIPQEEWDRLRKDCYQRYWYRCAICGGKGEKWPVECHEKWEYELDKGKGKGKQTLIDLVALCPACHQVKHIGLTTVKGKKDEARRHMAMVNNWPLEVVDAAIKGAYEVWQERNKFEWELDCQVDDEYLIKLFTQKKEVKRSTIVKQDNFRAERRELARIAEIAAKETYGRVSKQAEIVQEKTKEVIKEGKKIIRRLKLDS